MARAPEPSQEKKRLRREMIARRDAMPAAERERLAAAMARHVATLPEYRSARTVLATMSIGSEWSTRPFLESARADGKTIVLPRISSEKPKRLVLYAVGDMNRDLVAGGWGSPEPGPRPWPQSVFPFPGLPLVPPVSV